MYQLLDTDTSKRLSARQAADHLWLGGPERAEPERENVSRVVHERTAFLAAERDKLLKRRKRGRRVSCRVAATT